MDTELERMCKEAMVV